MTVMWLCAFRLDLTAPPNRFYRGTAIEGLFHPDRRSPSGGQDQSRPEGGRRRLRLILEQAGLNFPAPSTRLSRHRPRRTLEPSEPRRPPRADRQAQAAPLGSISIACLGRYQEPSP